MHHTRKNQKYYKNSKEMPNIFLFYFYTAGYFNILCRDGFL